MSNAGELKKLAEALTAHSEDSFYLPCTVAFERAANPAAILALIAENERLRTVMKGDYDLDAWLDWAKEAEALRAENERLRTAEGDAMTYKAGMENVARQRDQLKAELAGLRTGYEAFERVNAELRGEVEVLLKALRVATVQMWNSEANMDVEAQAIEAVLARSGSDGAVTE